MRESYRFSFEDIKVVNVLFQADSSWKKAKDKIQVETSLDIDYSLKGKKLSVSLGISHKEDESPFVFMVDAVGFFVFDKEPRKELVETVARINCSAIMFPYLREMIADLTRRAGFPPFHHPPVNFQALYEEFKASRIEELEKKPPAPRKKAGGKKTKAKSK